jgi:phosphopantothenoylcysteine decarboxylase / phosphopantothenate---cysteine ligase
MDDPHPSLDITGSAGSLLAGKRIALLVTGSVAAVRVTDIARGLMRLGAEVRAVMSEAAMKLIHPDLLHWATGHPVVTGLTGEIEHVKLAGNVPGRVDLMLLAPATANTIGKIAAGIDDTPVTSTVTSGLGQGIPLLIVPAMHESMYRHPLVLENIDKLKKIGVSFILPTMSEGKAKLADPEEIVRAAVGVLAAGKKLAGRKILVSLGRTVEKLDPVRQLTNASSGKMGAALVAAALLEGAEVTAVTGKVAVPLPAGAKTRTVETSDEMYEAVKDELTNGGYDCFIAAAAVSDWKPARTDAKKVSTHQEKKLTLELVPTRKIIDEAKDWAPHTMLVAFRAVYRLTAEELVRDAADRLKRARADLIVANDTGEPGSGFETDTNAVTVVSADGRSISIPQAGKREIAFSILEIINEKLSARA